MFQLVAWFGVETLKKERQHTASRMGGQPQPQEARRARKATLTRRRKTKPQRRKKGRKKGRKASPNLPGAKKNARRPPKEGTPTPQPREGTRLEPVKPGPTATPNKKGGLTSTRKKKNTKRFGTSFFGVHEMVSSFFFKKIRHYVFRLQCAICCCFKNKNSECSKTKKNTKRVWDIGFVHHRMVFSVPNCNITFHFRSTQCVDFQHFTSRQKEAKKTQRKTTDLFKEYDFVSCAVTRGSCFLSLDAECASVCDWSLEQTVRLIKTNRLKTTVDVCTLYIVQCQTTIDNKCKIEHSSSHRGCIL